MLIIRGKLASAIIFTDTLLFAYVLRETVMVFSLRGVRARPPVTLGLRHKARPSQAHLAHDALAPNSGACARSRRLRKGAQRDRQNDWKAITNSSLGQIETN